MKYGLFLIGLIIVFFPAFVDAATLNVAIDSPSSGSSYTVGDTFTVSATASCTGSGSCQDVTMTASFSSGLSTSSTNPQNCGNVANSCTQYWSVSVGSSGSKTVTISTSSSNAGSPTASTTVTANAAAACGNGIKESGEQCDGIAFGGASCSTLGYTGGTLNCDSSCDYNTVECDGTLTETVCGNRVCEGNENCNSCSTDCGQCLVNQLNIIPQSPLNNGIVKRGDLLFYVKVFYGSAEETAVEVKVASDLFLGIETLEESYPEKYFLGKKITIAKDKPAGEYTVKITAKKGNAKDEENLKINLNPELKIKMAGLQEGYVKGERIALKGKVVDFSGNPQENVKINVALANVNGAFFNRTVKTDFNGDFDSDYVVSFADDDGEMFILIDAEDDYGNFGKFVQKSSIGTPEGVAYYTVNFLSPLKGSSYARGDIVTVSVEVKEEDESVTGANVSLTSYSGDVITLEEVDPGVYSGSYKLDENAPLGNFRLAVQALKNLGNYTRAGGNSIPVYVNPGEVFIEILSPLKENAYSGTRIALELSAKDINGNGITGGLSEVVIGDTTVKLTEISRGVYGAYYKVPLELQGGADLRFNFVDGSGNKGVEIKNIFVQKTSYPGLIVASFSEYVLEPYWWVIMIAVIGLFFAYKPILLRDIHVMVIKRANEKQKIIANMEIEAERKYYKEKSITHAEFKQLMQEYEKRMAKQVEIKKASLNKLNKLLKKNKDK